MPVLKHSLAAGELDRRIAAFIQRPVVGEARFEESLAAQFASLALALFEYQYLFNEPYRRLCDQRGRTPHEVKNWRDIPAVSAASFSEARLATFPRDRARLVFESSGTTREGARASRLELEDPTLYDASLLTHFRRRVMPDRERMPMVLFSPSFDEAPHSSLAYMLAKIFERHGSEGGFFISRGVLDHERAVESLRSQRQPTLVFGTAFALLHFLDRCRLEEVVFNLPAGSRVVETGGFKGRSRSIERAEFYAMLTAFFGVPRELCLSEYGMCELGSQWYDANVADHFAGCVPRCDLKIGPHWGRHLIVDAVTAEPVTDSPGLLQLLDLSNRGSVAAVLTSDLARDEGEGFVFMGRAPGAPPKGCSISVDRLLTNHA